MEYADLMPTVWRSRLDCRLFFKVGQASARTYWNRREEFFEDENRLGLHRNAPWNPLPPLRRKLASPKNMWNVMASIKPKLAINIIIRSDRPDAKLILVTAVNPTPAGEGKTTVTIGLTQALQQMGKNALTCLREPSLGPCMGVKGGAAGGGYDR